MTFLIRDKDLVLIELGLHNLRKQLFVTSLRERGVHSGPPLPSEVVFPNVSIAGHCEDVVQAEEAQIGIEDGNLQIELVIGQVPCLPLGLRCLPRLHIPNLEQCVLASNSYLFFLPLRVLRHTGHLRSMD